MQSGYGFADWVEGKPKPGGECRRTNLRIQLVQLKQGDDEVAEQVIVPALTVVAHAIEPVGKRGICVTRETDEYGDVDPLSEKPEDEFDLFGTGYQIVRWRVDAAGEDFGASLALIALDAVVRAVADQRGEEGSMMPQ